MGFGKKMEAIELYPKGFPTHEMVAGGRLTGGFKDESWRELITESEVGGVWLWSLSR
jgi:uncharacterized protein YgfB (UPF0149 family)